MRVKLIAGLLAVAAVPVMAQTLTPREIFYGAYHQQAAPAKPRVAPKAKLPPTAEPPRISEPDKAGQPIDRAKQINDEQPAPAAVPVQRPPVQYATVTTEASPLVVRYSVQKSTECGYKEVDPEQTFRTGEQIRLVVQANDTGYLSIFQEGSSGKCSKVFPGESGTLKLDQGQKATIPGGDNAISIAPPSGVEKVYIVFSRQSEPDQALQDALKLCGAEGNPAVVKSNAMLAQSLGITGENGQNTFARDLVIEKQKYVEPKQTAVPVAAGACPDAKPERDEPAIYAINRKAGAKGRVVASFALRHQ